MNDVMGKIIKLQCLLCNSVYDNDNKIKHEIKQRAVKMYIFNF